MEKVSIESTYEHHFTDLNAGPLLRSFVCSGVLMYFAPVKLYGLLSFLIFFIIKS